MQRDLEHASKAASEVNVGALSLTIDDVAGLDLPGSSEGLSAAEQLQQVLARYVRAIDTRNASALRKLFTKDATLEIWQRGRGGQLTLVGQPVQSAEEIVNGAMLFFKQREEVIGHHVTHDLIYEVGSNAARINAQFIATRALPHTEASPDAPSVAGTVIITVTGYYDVRLQRHDAGWLISHFRDIMDLPYSIAL